MSFSATRIFFFEKATIDALPKQMRRVLHCKSRREHAKNRNGHYSVVTTSSQDSQLLLAMHLHRRAHTFSSSAQKRQNQQGVRVRSLSLSKTQKGRDTTHGRSSSSSSSSRAREKKTERPLSIHIAWEPWQTFHRRHQFVYSSDHPPHHNALERPPPCRFVMHPSRDVDRM